VLHPLLQVLHLAEVLHNTPKHALCVKALQRRAAAYQVSHGHVQHPVVCDAAVQLIMHARLHQAVAWIEWRTCVRNCSCLQAAGIVPVQGLGQYSKAVADLQAAADILPGDAEVSVGVPLPACIVDCSHAHNFPSQRHLRSVIASQ